MTDKVRKIMDLESKINDLFLNSDDKTEEEIEEIIEEKGLIDKTIKTLNRMNCREILEIIRRCDLITKLVDMKVFIKKYPLNKKELKENQTLYLEEFKKLEKTCYSLINVSSNPNEYEIYLDILDIDNVEKYLLNNMTNEQIYALASDTNIWDEKLYFFSYLKKEKDA